MFRLTNYAMKIDNGEEWLMMNHQQQPWEGGEDTNHYDPLAVFWATIWLLPCGQDLHAHNYSHTRILWNIINFNCVHKITYIHVTVQKITSCKSDFRFISVLSQHGSSPFGALGCRTRAQLQAEVRGPNHDDSVLGAQPCGIGMNSCMSPLGISNISI